MTTCPSNRDTSKRHIVGDKKRIKDTKGGLLPDSYPQVLKNPKFYERYKAIGKLFFRRYKLYSTVALIMIMEIDE